jgi:hypothetical protein
MSTNNNNNNNNKKIVFASAIMGAILATGILALNPSKISNAATQRYLIMVR